MKRYRKNKQKGTRRVRYKSSQVNVNTANHNLIMKHQAPPEVLGSPSKTTFIRITSPQIGISILLLL